MQWKYVRGAALMMGFTALLVSGCEEDVTGPDPHAYPYTMWGVINPLADTQFVRVFPIETSLGTGAPEPLDAHFTSLDLDTGEEWVWQDSVFADSVGVVGHVFYAPFRADWEHQYRLEIVRADGASSWVEVETPKRTTLVLGQPDTTQGVILPASIQGDAQNLLKSEVDIYVNYVTGFTPGPFPQPILTYYHHIIPYDENLRRTADGWELAIDLEGSYFPVLEAVSQNDEFVFDRGIGLLYIEFRVVFSNEDWMPPGGVFDPDVLIQPGAMENVQNGFGFVAAGYHLARSWTLPFDVIEKTQFLRN